MSLITEIEKSYRQISLIEDISGIFEGIASIRIRQIKNRVITSKRFFNELWQIYHQLRIDSSTYRPAISKNKTVFIVITAAGGLSGDIDNKIITRVMHDIKASATDVIVFGEHGAVLLNERGIKPIKVFALPNINKSFDISPVIKLAAKYKKATVYYQTFVSLTVQKVGVIDLILQTHALTKDDQRSGQGELITPDDYEFEPTMHEVADYMESVMLGIALQQMMLESRLAQFASRFTAMAMANNRARDAKHETRLELLAAKRARRDEASHQVIYSRGGGL